MVFNDDIFSHSIMISVHGLDHGSNMAKELSDRLQKDRIS